MRRFFLALRELLRGWALPLAFYTLAALIITWPLVTQLSTHVAGGGFADSFEYVRLGWWGKYALQNGLNPFYQSLLAYPDGFLSATQIAQPLIYWPISALAFVFGDVAAFNLWLLLEIILSGAAAYWLCRDVLAYASASGAVLPAALLGGLVFMAFPAIQGHLSAGHVNPLSNYALPIVALCLYRIATGRAGPRSALLGAVALLILALGNFTFSAYAALPLALFGGGYILLARRFRPAMLRDVLMMSGLGALLSLPFYAPLLAEALSPARPGYLQQGGSIQYSADLLAFVAPSPFTLWSAWFAPGYSRVVLGTNSAEGAAYLGIAAVILTVFALVRRREARLWLVVALGCMVFSLGPLLKIYDQPIRHYIENDRGSIVMPWAVFQKLPLLNIMRTPGRFNMTTGLALGVLVALGAQSALSRIRGRRTIQVGITGALAGIILFEYQLFAPFLTTPAALPQVFYELAARPDVRAVFDVPHDDPIGQKLALYQQTAHHKPLIAGYVSRATPVDPAKLAFLSDVATGRAAQLRQELASFGVGIAGMNEARAVLKANGVDVLIYHWQLLDRDAVLAYATAAFGAPAYVDDQIGVFEVPLPETAVNTLNLYLPGREGWLSLANDPERNRRLWMAADASLTVYATQPITQRWSASLRPLLGLRTVQVEVDGQVRLARSLEGAADVEFVVRLDAGFHTLRLVFPAGCTALPISPACLVAPADPGSAMCRLPADPAPVCVSGALEGIAVTDANADSGGLRGFQARDVTLSEGMQFRGYYLSPRSDPIRPGGQLFIETHWRAAQKLPGDYHLFIHLLDEDGQLVAQYDDVPGQRGYPTTVWAAPQDWQEMAALDLPADLPPGTYELYAGWYRYPDITRLGVNGDGPRAADGYVFLTEVEVR